MADLSPQVEACVERTITHMYDTGQIGQLIDSGMTYDDIVDLVVQECELEITGNVDVYVKRKTTVIVAIASGIAGITIGALTMHLLMGD